MVILYLSALTVLQAFPGLFAGFDDPARLGAPVHIMSTNGFTLRWAEKAAATNRAGCDLVFVHGSPGGAGVWATQFDTLATHANLFAYDRPGFGKVKLAGAGGYIDSQHTIDRRAVGRARRAHSKAGRIGAGHALRQQ